MDAKTNIDNTFKDLIEKNKNVPNGDVDILYENLLYLKAILSVAIPEHIDISTISHLISLAGDICESSLLRIENTRFDNEAENITSFPKN